MSASGPRLPERRIGPMGDLGPPLVGMLEAPAVHDMSRGLVRGLSASHACTMHWRSMLMACKEGRAPHLAWMMRWGSDAEGCMARSAAVAAWYVPDCGAAPAWPGRWTLMQTWSRPEAPPHSIRPPPAWEMNPMLV